jgi:hypothetical protein
VADLFFDDKGNKKPILSKDEFLNFLCASKNYCTNPISEIFNSHYQDYLKIFNEIDERKLKRRYFNSLNKVFQYWSIHNTSLDFYLCRGYNIEESKNLLKNRQSTMNLEIAKKIQNSIKSKSKDEIVEINRKKGNGNRFEFYLDKINKETNKLFTEEEAKLKIKVKQSTAFNNRWRKIKNGEIIYFPNTSINYYLGKGLSFEDAKNALIDRQKTFSLESCIERYGLEKGHQKFKDRQIKWQSTMNSKSDEEKESIKRSQVSRLSKYSKASFDYFVEVLNYVKFDGEIYFGKDEYVIYDKTKSRCFFFDFVIPKYKICIEYNGLAFHPHPDLDENSKLNWIEPFSKMNYQEKSDFDSYKNSLMIAKGYEVLIIWESDNNKIQKAVNFIKYKIQQHDNTSN